MQTQYIVPNQHNKAEWERMAQAADERGYKVIASKFYEAAHYPKASPMPLREFDALQLSCRAWLVFNEFEMPRP